MSERGSERKDFGKEKSRVAVRMSFRPAPSCLHPAHTPAPLNRYTQCKLTLYIHAMLCNAMLCNAMLCYTMLCYTILCYTMLCYAILCIRRHINKANFPQDALWYCSYTALHCIDRNCILYDCCDVHVSLMLH